MHFSNFYFVTDSVSSSSRNSRRHRAPYTATANYPGPPEDEGRQLGPTSLPSYKRTMIRLIGGSRTPPPEYKNLSQNHLSGNTSGGPPFLESMRSVITDSFMSWYSKDDDEEKNLKDVGAVSSIKFIYPRSKMTCGKFSNFRYKFLLATIINHVFRAG